MGRSKFWVKFIGMVVVAGCLLSQFYLVFTRNSRHFLPSRAASSQGSGNSLPLDWPDSRLARPHRRPRGPSGPTPSPPPLPALDVASVLRANSREEIHNARRFPFRLDEAGIVIIVQVHDRPQELRMLIESLRDVRYINETLVIFSHDLIKAEIHQIVNSVDFAPVLQLWYPYSIQLHRHAYPGDSPNDCSRNMSRAQADHAQCTNRKYPDSYGHYREAKFCQLKHHWLWKMEYVVNELQALRHFKGSFLRLDEDYYLLPDSIYLIRAVDRLLPAKCPDCVMGILGDREVVSGRMGGGRSGEIHSHRWYADIGRGMIFRKLFWNLFKMCSHHFCTFDDYNWDLSLQHLSVKCLNPGFKVWKPMASRLFHIGMCNGFHRSSKICNAKTVHRQVETVLDTQVEFFFPPFKNLTLRDRGKYEVSPDDPTENGGWADVRDHRFCMSLFQTFSKQQKTLVNIIKGAFV